MECSKLFWLLWECLNGQKTRSVYFICRHSKTIFTLVSFHYLAFELVITKNNFNFENTFKPYLCRRFLKFCTKLISEFKKVKWWLKSCARSYFFKKYKLAKSKKWQNFCLVLLILHAKPPNQKLSSFEGFLPNLYILCTY